MNAKILITLTLISFFINGNAQQKVIESNVLDETYVSGDTDAYTNQYFYTENDTISYEIDSNYYAIRVQAVNDYDSVKQEKVVSISLDSLGRIEYISIRDNNSSRFSISLKNDKIISFKSSFDVEEMYYTLEEIVNEHPERYFNVITREEEKESRRALRKEKKRERKEKKILKC
ncbi:MAG: hypothetical protein ACWA41_04575 [Putridiphycobacter sp.]